MRRGAILITTTWILAILTLFAVGIGFRVGIEIKLTGYNLDRLKALHIAKAGVRAAITEKWREYVEGVSLSADAYSEPWANNPELFKDARAGDGVFTLSYNTGERDRADKEIILYGLEDESAKININSRNSSESIRNLLMSSGLELEEAQAIVTGIEGWGGPAEEGESAQSDYPVEVQNAEVVEGGTFVAIEELMHVSGVTEEIYEKVLKKSVTPYGDGRVNINTASADTLSAVFGPGYGDLAAKVADFRRGVDGKLGTDDDRWFVSGAAIIDREDRGMVEVKDLNDENWYGNIFGITDIEYKRVRTLAASTGVLATTSDHYRASCEARIGKIKKDVTTVVKFNRPGAVRQKDFGEEIPPPDVEYLFWHEER